MQKIISAVLLIGGLILFYLGWQEYQSVNSEIEEFFTGSPDGGTMWKLIGGAAAAVAGWVGLSRGKIIK